jgi:single-strand DNA-binding protein
MNKVFLSGRWAREISLAYTSGGKAIAKCALAVDEGYGDKKKTHFLECELWEQKAEATANYSDRGLRVTIEGRLKVDQWEKDGQKRSMVKVVVDQIEFNDFKSKNDAEETGGKGRVDPFSNDGKEITDEKYLPF